MCDCFSSLKSVMAEERLMFLWKELEQKVNEMDGRNWFYVIICFLIFQGDCDFESGMCTYSNTQAEDQFDWLRNAGTTPSWQTGPKVDHTLGNGLGKLSS